MSIRKRNDAQGYRRGAMGIDGGKDDGFARSGKVGHLVQDATNSDHAERSYSRNSKRSSGDQWLEVGATEQPLRQVDDFGYTGATRDIYDLVDSNSGTGASGPVKNGVNLPQKK
jgi:hypothetical protein